MLLASEQVGYPAVLQATIAVVKTGDLWPISGVVAGGDENSRAWLEERDRLQVDVRERNVRVRNRIPSNIYATRFHHHPVRGRVQRRRLESGIVEVHREHR